MNHVDKMKEREMQSYIEEREREVAEREAAWKAELSRREVSHFDSIAILKFGFSHYLIIKYSLLVLKL